MKYGEQRLNLNHLGMKILLAVFLCLGIEWPAAAKLFSNSYLSFDLPDNWSCKADRTEFVCAGARSKNGKTEAIIIFAAKDIRPGEGLASFESTLKNPRTHTHKGKTITSKVRGVKQRMINNHPWVDGLHESSELNHFFTRYMLTTKGKLGVLVTFSAHRDAYTKYSGDFVKAIQSLRILASGEAGRLAGSGGAAGAAGGAGGRAGQLGGAPVVPVGSDLGDLPPELTGKNQTVILGLKPDQWLGVVLLLIAGFIYWRIKARKKPKKKKPSR